MTLAEVFRRHAGWLDQRGKSPLYAELMRGAADDVAAGGVTAQLFAGRDQTPDSAPTLRLLAPLHQLALSGRAPALATHYPSAGGSAGPDGAWNEARAALDAHTDWVAERLDAIVQTNEPGRACALYAGLRVLAARDPRPIRLLEIGASAGLNLRFDAYGYRVGSEWLGDAESPLRFEDPWTGDAGVEPVVADRAGCDLAPLDPASEENRTRLLSYIWPDETERIERLRTALELAAAHPMTVDAAGAGEWLTSKLAETDPQRLTVVWHSIMWQYLPEAERDVLRALEDTPDVAWLSMEPWHDPDREVRLTLRGPGSASLERLAVCDDHGPPLRWTT